MSAKTFTRNLSKRYSLRSKAAPQPAFGVKLGCIITINLVWFCLVVKTLTRYFYFLGYPFQTLMLNELMSEGNQRGFWCLYLDHFKRLNSRDVNFQQWISHVCDKRFELCFSPFLFFCWQQSNHCELWKGSCVLVAVCLRVWECSKTWPWDIGFHFWCYVNKENVSHV